MNNDKFSLNVRLLAILLGTVLALCIIALVVHRIQLNRQADIYLERARMLKESSEKQKDFDVKLKQVFEASGNYNRYTQHHPNDYDVMAENGLMLAEAAEEFFKKGRVHDAKNLYNNGLFHLEKVLREEPNRLELRRTLVQSLSALHRDTDAIDHITFLAKVPSDEDSLRELFDRYDLWQRTKVRGSSGSQDEILAEFLLPENKKVDREKLLSFLKDDLWMVLEDAELLSIYGKSQIRLNRPELAEKPLEMVVFKSPDNLKAYRELADLLCHLDRQNDADYWMSEVVTANPDSFEAIRMRGEYRLDLVRRARKSEAIALTDNALADAIQSICNAIEQAIDKADAAAPSSQAVKDLKTAFNQAQQVKPKNNETPTPEYRDRLLTAAEKLKTLSRDLPRIKKSLEGVRDGLLLASRCELAAAHIKASDARDVHLANSLAYGTQAADLFPGHSAAYLVLASVEQELGHQDKAIEWLRQGSDSGDSRPTVLWHLATALIQKGRLEEARRTIDEMAAEEASEIFLSHLEAMLDYAKGDWASAKERFEQILPQLNNWPQIAIQAHLLLANCCEKLGLVDQQREVLMHAAALDLTSIGLLLKRAQLEMESDQLDEAIEDYRFALRLRNAPPSVYISLTRALLARNLRLPKSERNWGEVEATIKEAEKILPDSLELTMLRAELLAARDHPEKADALMIEILKSARKKTDQLREQHQLATKEAESLSGESKKKKLNEAAQLLRQIKQYENIQTSIWQSRVQLAERQEQWEKAKNLIKAVEESSGDSPRMRLLKAHNIANRIGKDAAPELKKLLSGSEHFTPEQQTWLWHNFAAIAYEIHDYRMATELCNRLLKKEPDNLGLQKLRFQIASAQKDVDAMARILDQIKSIENEPSAYWHYGEAMRLMMLVDQGGTPKLLQRALDNLDVAAKKRPKWEQVSLLAGMIHERVGNVDAAIDSYLEAINLGTNDPNMVKRAAQLLIRNNRLREADRMFHMLTEREPLLSEEIGREKRMVKTKLGKFDAALGPARKVAATSNKVEDHIWLGQLLSMASQRMRRQDRDKEAEELLKEAEDAFRHAVILKIDAPEPWVALVQFYAQTRQIDKAEKTIGQARLKLPPAVAATALGQCYEILQQPDKAVEQYEIAIKSAPNDPVVAKNAANFFHRINQIEKAQAQLLRIIQGKVDATREEIKQARRNMALIAQEQGGREKRKEAIAWIEKNLTEDPQSVVDQFYKAYILSEDLSGKHRQEAIASLENILNTHRNPGPNIQFTLAQLYLADGNWREYKLRMDKLLKSYHDVPQYIAAYIIALIDHKDYNEAEIKAGELAKLAPNNPRTVAIRAELAFRQKQFARARDLWKDYLDDPSIGHSEKTKRLSMVANALEDFAVRLRAKKENTWAKVYSKQANHVYQQYVDAHPGQELLMASFLAKQERLDEAIDLIDTLWETSDPKQIAIACFNVIDGKGASKEQINRIDRILRKVAAEHPNALVIQITLAVIRSLQEQFEEAEAMYRQILVKTPNNPTALNNLAVLLAQNGVKLKEAASLIDRAIRQAGPTDQLLDSRAIVQLALNHPEKALEDLKKAIEKQPTAMRYFHQAEAFHANGQRKEAVQAFDRAINMGLREDYLQGVERRKFKKLRILLK